MLTTLPPVLSMKIKAMFCTPECYRDSCTSRNCLPEGLSISRCVFWRLERVADLLNIHTDKKHKKLHKKVDIGTYTYPEGSTSSRSLREVAER